MTMMQEALARVRELRFKIWSWWRASRITPDPAYMDRQAMITKILWLQDQLDAATRERAKLISELERDDFLLGRPSRRSQV